MIPINHSIANIINTTLISITIISKIKKSYCLFLGCFIDTKY